MSRLATVTAMVLGLSVSSAALADEDVSKEDLAKILKAMSGLGCTEIKGEAEDEGTHFEVDDLICQGKSYDLQIDKDMKVITMVRDPGS